MLQMLSATSQVVADAPSGPSRIPSSFVSASWRCTLPVDPTTRRLGLAFTLAGGEMVRLAIPVLDARHLSETIADYLDGRIGTTSQSPRSSEMPSSPGSIPDDGKNV